MHKENPFNLGVLNTFCGVKKWLRVIGNTAVNFTNGRHMLVSERRSYILAMRPSGVWALGILVK